jgi:hypothetical protein
MNVKKTVLALSATVAALALAPAANAAVVDPIILSGNPLTDSFGGTVSGGAFSDVFNFTLPSNGTGTSLVSSIALSEIGEPGDLEFTSVILDGVYSFDVVNGFISAAGLGKTWLNAGAHSLVVSGTSIGSASYGGNFNVAPVPEPATWALMIAGLGVVGMAMRRRSSAKRNVAVSFV